MMLLMKSVLPLSILSLTSLPNKDLNFYSPNAFTTINSLYPTTLLMKNLHIFPQVYLHRKNIVPLPLSQICIL